LFPHFGQNFTFGVNGVPQRLQLLSLVWSCLPQLPQKVLPCANGVLHDGQVVASACSGAPQLMQRLAFC
jgi:hypothetical protein